MNCERVFTVRFTPPLAPGHTDETWHVVADDALAAIDAVRKYTAPAVALTKGVFRVEKVAPLVNSRNEQVWVYLPDELAKSPAGAADDDIPHEVNAEGEKVITSSDLLKMFPNGIATPLTPPPPASPGMVSGGATPDIAGVEVPRK